LKAVLSSFMFVFLASNVKPSLPFTQNYAELYINYIDIPYQQTNISYIYKSDQNKT